LGILSVVGELSVSLVIGTLPESGAWRDGWTKLHPRLSL